MAKKSQPSKQTFGTSSGRKSLTIEKLVDHRALRASVLLAVLLLAAYTAFFRLGVEKWDIE